MTKPVDHGTRSSYVNGCRCDACREANTRHCREAKERRLRAGLADDDPRHGHLSTYSNWNCRCDKCSAAWSAEMRRQHELRKGLQVERECVVCGAAFVRNGVSRRVTCSDVCKQTLIPPPPGGGPVGEIVSECRGCGAPRDPETFSRSNKGPDGLRPYCKRCWNEHRRASGDGLRRAVRNGESRAVAHKHRQEWTGPELEMVMRSDLTTAEIARRLGRTRWAVEQMRRRCRDEPKYLAFVGLGDQESDD